MTCWLVLQVATQQGKYLAQVMKDNPMILQPGPTGPTVRSMTTCCCFSFLQKLCLAATQMQMLNADAGCLLSGQCSSMVAL